MREISRHEHTDVSMVIDIKKRLAKLHGVKTEDRYECWKTKTTTRHI
jgi:hypothetical protein